MYVSLTALSAGSRHFNCQSGTKGRLSCLFVFFKQVFFFFRFQPRNDISLDISWPARC